MSSTECSLYMLYDVIPISSILSWPRYQVVKASQSSGCHGDGSPQVSMGYSRWCKLQVMAPLCDPRLWPLYATPGCGPSMRLQVVAPLCDSRLWPLYATPGCGPSMRLQVVAPLCDSRLWPLHATPGCGPSMRCSFVLAVGQQCSHMAGMLGTQLKGHPHTEISLTPQTRLRDLVTGTSEIAFTNSKTTNM